MELVSSTDLALTGVASPAAARAELHSTSVEEGVMRMRPVASIELPSKKAVKLAPGGLHIMLIDVKQPLKAGDKVPLTLTVQRADLSNRFVLTVQAEVRLRRECALPLSRRRQIPKKFNPLHRDRRPALKIPDRLQYFGCRRVQRLNEHGDPLWQTSPATARLTKRLTTCSAVSSCAR
jgi:hypothetical protein